MIRRAAGLEQTKGGAGGGRGLSRGREQVIQGPCSQGCGLSSRVRGSSEPRRTQSDFRSRAGPHGSLEDRQREASRKSSQEPTLGG